MANLASEMVVSVENLPLETYSDGILAAVPLIGLGKLNEAKAVLLEVLDTVAPHHCYWNNPQTPRTYSGVAITCIAIFAAVFRLTLRAT